MAVLSDVDSNNAVLVVADVSAEHVNGGAERMLYHHIRALVQSGFDVTVLTRQPEPDAPLFITLKDFAVSEHRLPFSGDKSYQGLQQLKQAAKIWWVQHGNNFDVVVAEQPFVMWALKQAGCYLPRLQVCHSFAFEEYQTRHALHPSLKHSLAMWSMKKLEKEVYGSARKLLVLSEFMQQRLDAFFAIQAGRSVVVAGAADEQELVSEQMRQQLRSDLGWGSPVITTLRNLVPRTGVDLLIQAAAIVKVKRDDVRWVVMGDGLLRGSMQKMVKELGVDDVITFTGFIPEEDVQNRLAASDVFMVPTRGLEGFGLVTLEANVCGVPVLATPIAANAELVPKMKHNQLAENASPLALAEKVLWMLEHPVDAVGRQTIREDALRQYSWQKHDAGFVSLMRDLEGLNS